LEPASYFGASIAALGLSAFGWRPRFQFFQAISAADLIGSPDKPLATDNAALRGICGEPLCFALFGAPGIFSAHLPLRPQETASFGLELLREH